MSYFDDEKNEKKGSFFIENATVEEVQDKRDYCFRVTLPNSKKPIWLLSADTRKDMLLWMDAIRRGA